MTIDERLDRLTERHEALTQSVELMNHGIDELRATMGELKGFIQQDAENIRALARIAEAHEHRIGDLEDHQN